MLLLNPTRSRTCTIVQNKHKPKHKFLPSETPGCIRQKHDRWPQAHHVLTRWPARPGFSPYDVLEQPRDGPYSKRRFYELVMVYHPDRWVHGTYHGIPKQTRVERYRIILAANAILSDPVRRRAYDEYGVGWTPGGADLSRRSPGQPWKGGNGGNDGNSRNAKGQRDEQYPSGGDSCHWEGQPRGSQQRPIFMDNSSFAAMLLWLASSLSYLLWSVASSRAESISKRQDLIHKRLLRELDSIAARRYK